MSRTRPNTQMFALRGPPPAEIEIAARHYRLVRAFKHDFFAATCLYELAGGQASGGQAGGGEVIPRIVVKFGRRQQFCGLPCQWIARFLCRRERAMYAALAGVRGVPRWAGTLDECSYAIEYVDGRPLDHLPAPPPGFFDRLREVFDALHVRGVGYGDANKRSNILVGRNGQPFLVDYQISIRRRDDLPWPLRALMAAAVRYVARADLYHLYKHKRRLCPGELTPQEEALSRRRRGLHWLHRKLTKPYRALRRRFLRRQYEQGRLVSPTADMEDHCQPEKQTWRKRPG